MPLNLTSLACLSGCLMMCLGSYATTIASDFHGSEPEVRNTAFSHIDEDVTPIGSTASVLLSTNTYSSTDIPVAIFTSGASTIQSIITVPTTSPSIISQIRVTNLDVSHTFIDDLTFKLKSPSGTEVTLASGLCGSDNDLSLAFSDGGANYFSIPCPPTSGLSYKPSETLAVFEGETAAGTWTLFVEDKADLDGGSLDAWEIEITTTASVNPPCTAPTCNITHSTVGSCSSYTLSPGDVLCVNEDYNCSLTMSGGTVYVSPGVTFEPNFSGGMHGVIINCGNSVLNNPSISNSTTIENYGSLDLTNLNINATTSILNGEGAVLNIDGNLQLNNSSTIINKGEFTTTQTVTISTGSSFSNDHLASIGTSFIIESGSTVRNNGRLIAEGGEIHINAGSSVFNHCNFQAVNDIYINASFQNNGLLFTGTGNIVVNGSATFTNNGNVVTNDLEVNGLIVGSGFLWCSGFTRLNALSFGSDGKGLNIYDSSTPPGGQFFDVETGTVDPSASNNPPTVTNPIPLATDLDYTCSNISLTTPIPDCPIGLDNDGDGITDFCDLDDDNDGIPDVEECPTFTYGPELILNGDFEDGYANWNSYFNRGKNNNGPTSDGCSTQGWIAVSPCASDNGECNDYYDYNGSTPTGTTLITDAFGSGANVIPTSTCNSTTWNCLAESLPDHTSGTGMSVYIDPSNVSGRAYWYQTVTISSNTNYEFSAWFMVIEEDPSLEFRIDGNPIGPSFDLDRLTGGSDGPDAWQQYFVEWNSGSTSGPVVIELINLRSGCGGNDIRIDDISLRSRSSSCDADGDGISNHLDLDSDNDGIYDLIEAGHGATDANTDGVIDGAVSTFGSNGLHNSIETFNDSDIINYSIPDSEGAPDGIYDAYEIDSDGDGCFDTREESISDVDLDGIAGNGIPTVDSDGIVVSATYASPSNNTWQNAAVSSCPAEICNNGIDDDGDGLVDCADCADCASSAACDDGDGDNIGSYCDIDDDNDGIPDAYEIESCIDNDYFAWNFNSPPGTRIVDEVQNAEITDWLIQSTSSVSEGAGITGIIPETEIQVTGITSLNYSQALASNSYIEASITTGSDLVDPYIQLIGINWYRNSDGTTIGNAYQAALAISDDNFSTSVLLSSDIDIHYPSDGISEFFTLTPANFRYLLQENTTYTFRIYVYNQQSDGNVAYSVFDDFTIRVSSCQQRDTDGDLVADHIDLDSDNDGLFDLLESGHAATDANTDGIIDGAPSDFGINGLFDGIETSADSDVIDYTISDSESSPDGVYDAYEIDSDDDGCPDVFEAGFTDGDFDAELGNSNVSIDANGVVTSAADGYTGTSSFVTNPARQLGCPDNDGDFISDGNDDDDDNDGITDFTEFDCSSAWLAFNLTWSQSNTTNDAIQIQRPVVIASAQPFSYGSGHAGVSTSRRVDIPVISSTTLAEAILNNEYIEYEFTTQNLTGAVVLGEMSHNKNPSSSGATENSYGYHVGISISKDGFTTQQMLSYGYFIDKVLPAGWNHDYILGDNEDYQLEPSETYTIRVYFFNKITPGTARFDDFAVLSYDCENPLDQDGDNTFNHKDLDSDGDTCSDVREAGFTDDDGDGVLGNSPTSVNDQGLVSPRPNGYSNPRQTVSGTPDYLSVATKIACLEICTNGIDDDGDGLIDCADQDCPGANPAIRVNRL